MALKSSMVCLYEHREGRAQVWFIPMSLYLRLNHKDSNNKDNNKDNKQAMLWLDKQMNEYLSEWMNECEWVLACSSIVPQKAQAHH